MNNNSLKATMFNRYFFAVNCLLLFVFLFYVVSIKIKSSHSTDIPQETTCPVRDHFALTKQLQGIAINNVKEGFPYKTYLDSADICDVNSIKKDLAEIDSVNHNHSESQEIISIALTKKLEDRIAHELEEFNPDSLIKILQWADRFNYYQDLDSTNARLFSPLHSYWINFISNQLGKHSDKKPTLKYDFKFRYLLAVCQSKLNNPPIGNSHNEKIILYIIDKDWAHLFDRFWFGTTPVFKVCIALVIISTISGYCLLAVKIYKLLCSFIKRIKK